MKLTDKVLTRLPSRKACLRGLFRYLPVIVMAASAVALLVIGLTLGLSYRKVRHFEEEPTVCKVRGVLHKDTLSCTCFQVNNVRCRSRYPCMEILVQYTDVRTEELVDNATLFSDPYDYETLHHDQCSVIPCSRHPDVNNNSVWDFLAEYGVPGRTFVCYHGEVLYPEALLAVIERDSVLLGLILPAAIFVLAGIVELCYRFLRPKFQQNMAFSSKDDGL